MSTPVGPKSQYVFCPICRTNVISKITPRSTAQTHLLALLLCVFGCIPCACCLYCTGCARNVEHYCPNCDSYLGVYER